MADETTQAPVAGATENNATQETEKKMYVYYYSDPDEAVKDLRFHEIYTFVPFSELPWHVHAEKPDESLKDPVWSLEANSWVENSKDGQAQILAEAQAKIVELDKAKDNLDQTLQTVKATQQAATQQNLGLTKMMQAMQESQKEVSATQQNTNKVLASMQSILLGLQASNASTAQPAVPNSNSQPIDVKEN